MTAPLKPPITYFGSKTAIAPRIATLLPPHGHYVEPYCGSLAVLLAKSASRMETVNDLDGDLMNFWRVLRDHPADLERACALTPHSRGEYEASPDLSGRDDLERARRVWVRLTQGRGGHLGRSTGWRHIQNPQNPGGGRPSMPDYLATHMGRLASAARRIRDVSLECRPALQVIERYGQHSGCLIYADPPYLKSVRTWSNGRSYGDREMHTEAEHRELADALRAARAAVVLSGYPSSLYDELYQGWHREEIATQTGNGGIDQARTEVLWSNRPFPHQGSLFDLEAS